MLNEEQDQNQDLACGKREVHAQISLAVHSKCVPVNLVALAEALNDSLLALRTSWTGTVLRQQRQIYRWKTTEALTYAFHVASLQGCVIAMNADTYPDPMIWLLRKVV